MEKKKNPAKEILKRKAAKATPSPKKNKRARRAEPEPEEEDEDDDDQERGPNGTPVVDREEEAKSDAKMSNKALAMQEARRQQEERAATAGRRGRAGKKEAKKEVDEEPEEEEDEEKEEEEPIPPPKKAEKNTSKKTPKKAPKRTPKRTPKKTPKRAPATALSVKTSTPSPSSFSPEPVGGREEVIPTTAPVDTSQPKYFLTLAIVPIITTLLFFATPDAASTVTDLIKSTTTPNVPAIATCYADKFPPSRHSDLLSLYGDASPCSDRGYEASVCPQHGVCYDGNVVSCDYLTSLPLLSFSDGACSLNSDGEALESVILGSLKGLTQAHTCHCFGLFKYSSTCPLLGVKVDSNHGHPLFPSSFVYNQVKSIEGLTRESFDLVTSSSPLVIASSGALGLERSYAKKSVEFSVLCYVQLILADVAWWCLMAALRALSIFFDILKNLGEKPE